MSRCVYVDDEQIERLVLQRFEPGRPVPVTDVTATLEVALESREPVIYVRIEAATGDER